MQDNTRFDGRVAIVTGAGSRESGTNTTTIGNGRAIAALLARRGARVLLLDVAQDWLRGHRGDDRAPRAAPARARSATWRSPPTAPPRWPRPCACGAALDILVNNVGISGPPGDATVVDADAWDHAMLVNVKSVMLMAKHAVPEMRKQGAGAIVNLASIAGLQGGHPGLLYATTKGAIVQMTRAMAAHHGGDLIRVNARGTGLCLHADGRVARDVRGTAPAARQCRAAQDRGQRLGRRGGRLLPRLAGRALDHRRDAAGRCRPVGRQCGRDAKPSGLTR